MAFKLTFKLDGPLEFRWKMHLPELASAIKASIRREFPNTTEALARSFNLSGMRITKNPDGVQITSTHPGAEAQEFGARIPERVAKRASAMHWTAANGDAVYAKRARGFTLRGRGYVEAAVYEWAGLEKGIDVEWKK